MCNNRYSIGKYDCFIQGYKAAKRLEEFWSANGNAGIASIWTSFGPRFFDMAQTTPYEVLRELKEEFDVPWTTVAKWLDAVSVDDLH